jgi:hypothetical protein
MRAGDGEAHTVTEKMTIYRFGGWEIKSFEQFEGEFVVTIAYADTKEEPKTQEELDKTLRYLNVKMSFERASEFGGRTWRAAEDRLQTSKAVAVPRDPPFTLEPVVLNGDALLHMKHPILRWLHFALSRDTARQIGEELLSISTAPPPPAPAGGA